MILAKSKTKGGARMFPLKKAKYESPSKVSDKFSDKLCDGTTQRVHNNLKNHKNKKLI